MTFSAVHYCPVPYAMTMTLVRCSIYVLFIRVFFTRAFSKLGQRWYSSLLRDSHEICRFFADTYFPPSLLTSFNRRDVAAGVFRIVTILWVKFHSDVTFTTVNGEIWAMAEVSIAIVVACCPLLRPLLEKLIPKRLAQWAHSHGSHSTIVTIRPARLENPEIFLP